MVPELDFCYSVTRCESTSWQFLDHNMCSWNCQEPLTFVKKCKNNQIFVMEMTGITFTLKANPGNSFITMKSPGITLSFHKIFFWNNASYSWQFLDHYMWIRNCQDCMYNPKVSAPTHLKPLRQALYFLTLPWVIRGKTQLG